MRIAAMVLVILVISPIATPDENTLTPISAKEIYNNIKNNMNVEYDKVFIIDDLDLNNSTLALLPKNKVNGGSFSDEILFKFPINIKIVNASIIIRNSIINGSVDFSNASFKNSTDFTNTTFKKKINFNDSQFGSTARFFDSKFEGDATFEGSKFNGCAEFAESSFNGTANFDGSRFANDSDFMDCRFIEGASFMFTEFDGPVYFSKSIFSGPADFGSSKFKDEANFFKTKFSDILDIGSIEFNKLSIKSSSLENVKPPIDDPTYQLLIENFKRMGFQDDADILYYRFRAKQVFDSNIDRIMRFLNFWPWIFYGFGKKPLYPVLWSAFFIVLFGFAWLDMGSKKSKIVLRMTSLAWIYLFIAILGYLCLKDAALSANVEFREIMVLILLILFMASLAVVRHHTGSGSIAPAIEEYVSPPDWPAGLLDALSFSATVFFSGAKFLVDPPEDPTLQGISSSFVKRVILAERVLGALFMGLFFLAINGTVFR